MRTVTLTDPDRALLAATWCNSAVGKQNWGLEMRNVFSKWPRYDFTFVKPEDATLFALKWI